MDESIFQNNIIKLQDIGGKPLEKLIDTVAKGIGTLYEPIKTKREIDSIKYELNTIKNIEEEIINKTKDPLLQSFLKETFFEKIRKKNNIKKVIENAGNELILEKSVSKEPVDNDWIIRFFNITEDISDEKMQEIWGKILAGEIKKPKSFSLRTLELLKNISKEEAKIFSKTSKFIIKENKTFFIFNDTQLLEDNGLTFEELLVLEEIGIIQKDLSLEFKWVQEQSSLKIIFRYGKYIITFFSDSKINTFTIPIIKFTNIGKELTKLINIDFNEDYLNSFKNNINRDEIDISIKSME